MTSSPTPRSRTRRAALAIALALVCASCGEEIVVRVTTRIWPQGGLNRRVEITGRDEEGAKPKETDWLASRVGVALANPGAWSRVDDTPGHIVAEGFFQRAEDLPPTLSHKTGGSVVADHAEAMLHTDDLVVLRRWLFRETLSDPYGANETTAALDGVVAASTDFLREQAGGLWGDDVNLGAAEGFLRGEARTLLGELLPTLRQNKTGKELSADARKEWRAVLTRHGVPIDPAAPDPFSGNQAVLLSSWMRAKVAQALTTNDVPVRPDDLVFWPGSEDEPGAGGMTAEEDLTHRIEPLLPALSGYYGDIGGPRFRFEVRVVVAGKLLRTNGTPDRDSVVWVFRDDDLAKGPRTLETESVEPNDDALRSLGARRDLDAADLLQLTDLLTERDTAGQIRKVLVEAVRAGKLELLRDAKVPAEVQGLARELADLLDPAVEHEPSGP